jgi:Saxitoxin biosynthesis operon protein SxtJ
MQQASFENFSRSKQVGPGSERSFGLVMAAVLSLLGAINFWHQKQAWRWLVAIALCFAVAALVAPRLLKPLNKLWYKFGMMLHAAVNPIIMGILFFVAIWPTGLVFRLRRKDLLRLKREPDSSSYWIVRLPPGPAPETMKDQF